MAILAYLSGRRAALRGSGMRSNGADSFRATHLQSGLRTQAALSRKSGTHCAAEKPHQRAPNRTGTVAHELCAGPVRTTFAHDLCASSISHIAFVHLRLGHCARSFPVLHQRGGPVLHQRGYPVLHQRGGPVLHQRGSKWRERPPRLRTSCGSDPRMQCASRGPVPPSLRGGRSRHSDPCRKARIAEG